LKHLDVIPTLFKTEYSNLVAVLCHYYGLKNIQLAEDIVSETFVKAMKTWSIKGVPDNPKAWLRTVAANQSRDHHRRQKTKTENVLPEYLSRNEMATETTFNDALIEDSQLNMIFAVCHPQISIEAQICMALRILCGFSIDEIAAALLSNKEGVNKKLYRAKKKFKELNPDFHLQQVENLSQRQDGVLRVLYLIFNEGYYSNHPDKHMRKELCWEAMRLALLLTKQSLLNQASVNALIALMCFHASRFEARVDKEGNYLLYAEQDKELWNQTLIIRGQYFLNQASEGTIASKYHLEAAIAYWHTTEVAEKWENILQLYNKLLTIEYSTQTALSRTYALAMANSIEEAIKEAKKLDLKENHLYYSLLSELYRMHGNSDKELKYLDLAIDFAKHKTDLLVLKRKREKNKP